MVPPRTGDSDYSAGLGEGGDGVFGAGEAGGPGRVVLSCNASPSPSTASCVVGSQSFVVTDGPEAFEVPEGCATVAVKAWAAGGGSGGEPGHSDSVGGAGGYAAGRFSAVPGELLLVWVGHGGSQGIEDSGLNGNCSRPPLRASPVDATQIA